MEKTPFERAVDEAEGQTHPEEFSLFCPSVRVALLRIFSAAGALGMLALIGWLA